MVIKKYILINLIFSLALFSLLFSNLFYVKIPSQSVSLYFLISLPLLVMIFFITRKIYSFESFFIFYFFMIFFFLISILGVFFSGNFGGLAQIYIYVFIPLTFFYFGILIEDMFIYKNLAIILFITFLFSLGQFLYFNFSISGPIELFKYFSDVIKISQVDFEVELIGSRSSGIFVNPNILGFFGGLSFLIFLYFKDKYNYNFINFIIFISLLIVFISSSRTSILALILSFIILFLGGYILTLDLKKFLKEIISLTVIFFISLYLMLNFSSEYYMERFLEIGAVAEQGSVGSGNLDSRVNAWSNLIYYIQNNPFGTIMPPQLVIDYSPDNQFIYFWLQGGYFLLFVFIFLFIALIRKSFEYKSIYLFSITFFLILSSFTFVTFNSFVIGLFWLFVGIIFKKHIKVL